MRTLYLDTSSSFLYFGIVDDDKLVCEIKELLGKDLSTLTLYKIENQMNLKNINPNSINRIIIVNGPGSFTGVRIGITIAKTWAWALDIPIIPISSLEAMALSSSTNCNFLIPLIDARRGYVYTGIYDDSYELILKNQYIKLETLKIAVQKLGDSYIYITNDSFDFFCEKYNPNILKIVLNSLNKKSLNPHILDADYLKNTEAEEKLNDN